VILDTAERLFAARGVDGIAVRALAREMGITASSLYNHFSGKEALYAAVLERGLRPIVELVIEAWQDPGLRPGRMNTTLDRLTAHLAHHPHLARLLQRALLEDTGTAQELIARWVSSLYREGLNVLRREARRAGWETAEVPHLGVALFGMIFAYFTDAGALRRLAGWDGDPFSERALAIQRRFLERALCRLLATARATARARAAARRTRTAEEQGWLTAAGSPTRASRGCASASARGSPVGGRGGRR
jgi:AcrR family transcriptional regulator